MSASEIWRLCAVKIGDTTIGQITDQEVSDSIRELLARDSTGLYNAAAAVDLEDVRIRFSTEAIKTALGAIGLTGVSAGDGSFVAVFAQLEHGGGYKASGCLTLTAPTGLGLWRGINAPAGGLATASFELVCTSADGSTHPLTLATGSAIPAAGTEEMYVAGGSSGIQQFSINTGLTEIVRRGDSEVFPTLAAIGACQPRARFTQSDAPTSLGALTDLDSLTLQDVVKGGGRGTSPITFTFNQNLGNASRIGETHAFEIVPTYDGTNAPIVITGLT